MPWGPLPPVPLIGLSAAPSASVSPGKSEVYDTDASREGEREGGKGGREEMETSRQPGRRLLRRRAAAEKSCQKVPTWTWAHLYLFSQTDRPIGRPACWSERQEAATFLA